MTNALLAITAVFILLGGAGFFIGGTLIDTVRTVPFGVCTPDHPNFSEKLCPKDELQQWRILQEDRVLNDMRWGDMDCKCPQQKDSETPLEKWDRMSCNKVCFEDDNEEESFENASALPFDVCDPSHPNYDQQLCPTDEIRKWRILQERRVLSEMRWTDLGCKCPEERKNQPPLEQWEARACKQFCSSRSHVQKETITSEKVNVSPCDPDSADYNPEECGRDPILKWRWEQVKSAREKIEQIKKGAQTSSCGCHIEIYDEKISPLDVLRRYQECEALCETSTDENYSGAH